MKARRTIGNGKESVYVYYFPSQAKGSSWPCKIGRAKGDPIERIRMQQASMQEEPLVALVIKTGDSSVLEALIHSSLKKASSFGREWFVTNPIEVEKIVDGRSTSLVSVGLRVRSLRRLRRLTQRDLADRSGLLPKSISSIENDGEFLFSTLSKVLDVLDVEFVLQSRAVNQRNQASAPAPASRRPS